MWDLGDASAELHLQVGTVDLFVMSATQCCLVGISQEEQHIASHYALMESADTN